MKRWKKIALVVLALVLISQAPFAYRRYKLGRLQATINTLNAHRVMPRDDDPYVDHRGVIHVHTHLGGHSTGTFDELVAAAKSNGLSFVVMTEHPAKYVNTAEMTLKGAHEGVLFINGSELNPADDDRLLVMPGIAPPETATTKSTINGAKRDGRLVFVAYPEQLRSWDVADYDGLEVYNLYTNTKKINYGLLAFDALWSYRGYPHLLFSTFYERPHNNLKKWDELIKTQDRKLVAVAGNDAHANVGLSFQHLTGEKILQFKFDPYERSFQVVRVHALLGRNQPVETGTVLSSLAQGHCFISFDIFGDAGGFRFTAENGIEKKIMGDEIKISDGGVRLSVRTPVKSRMVFFRNGEMFHEEREVFDKELLVGERGVYRVEVYLNQLGKPLSNQPWIITNPIYVR
ncbi:MAG TPA: hypothetical protein VM866_08970 [Pyrinomonadaceae bacterium]|nr:hypothetical protein [Pyrinomonadaceae bacterium]